MSSPNPSPEPARHASAIWDAMLQTMGADYLDSYPVLGDAFTILGQAVAAYDGGAHEGTSLLCRSAVGAAMYLFATHEPREGFWTFNAPRFLDGGVRRVTFDELENVVRQAGVLAKTQLTNLRRIKDHGDLIAHVAERHGRIWTEIPSNRSPEQTCMWIGPDEGYADLRDTAAILESIARAIARKSPKRQRANQGQPEKA
jgi:hypothetical protein